MYLVPRPLREREGAATRRKGEGTTKRRSRFMHAILFNSVSLVPEKLRERGRSRFPASPVASLRILNSASAACQLLASDWAGAPSPTL